MPTEFRWLSHQNASSNRKGRIQIEVCLISKPVFLTIILNSLATPSTFCDFIRMVIRHRHQFSPTCPPWFDLTCLWPHLLFVTVSLFISPHLLRENPTSFFPTTNLLCPQLMDEISARHPSHWGRRFNLLGQRWVPLSSTRYCAGPAQNLTNQSFFTLAARVPHPQQLCGLTTYFQLTEGVLCGRASRTAEARRDYAWCFLSAHQALTLSHKIILD